VCPVTSRVRGYPFEVALPQGLDVGGVVLAD
jgi:mRNA interferase MazF